VSWSDHHSLSEKLAVDAELARRSGQIVLAESLYRKSAIEEVAALEALESDKARTRGITAVSAVALWYKGREFSYAERLAHRCLGVELPAFAEIQLRDLLSAIWTAKAAEKNGIRFIPGDVLVSVRGGQVIQGGAPLDLIVRKVEGIQSVLFRTVEMLLSRPFRRRGGPPADIQSMFRPWLFQAPVGSYQFAVRVQEPDQRPLWSTDRPQIENVTSTFFRVLQATAKEPEDALPAVVPDAEYRSAFVSLARNLAPTGKTFERLVIADASMPTQPHVTFASEARQDLNAILKKLKTSHNDDTFEVVTIRGILRGLHLDRDWLEVMTDEPFEHGEHVRIREAGEVLDDVVGPMVNRRVLVSAERRGAAYTFRDIELEE
jgi:hypothetical protein